MNNKKDEVVFAQTSLEEHKMSDYVSYNQDRWDRISSKQGNSYTVPISHEEFLRVKNSFLEVSLTVGKMVPLEWFEKARGKKAIGVGLWWWTTGTYFCCAWL
ncbi:hypothetical protein GUT183_12880 [Streptococcus ruminantium]|nr:hypothetical protein GUT183_12880 [Streptococcus ruminantium]